MKLRPLLILLLFVASTGIVAWIYHVTRSDNQAPKPSPWAATLVDLDACCRRKHVKGAQYDHFAQIAGQEQQLDAERLFRALALSERTQEANCANAIVRLGGNYTPPSKVVVFRATTADNLDRSIAYERLSLDTLRGTEIRRALDTKNRYAARVLIWASAGDLCHLGLMERCRSHCSQQQMPPYYLVCPVCGNLYASDHTCAFCPHCLTDGRKFIRYE